MASRLRSELHIAGMSPSLSIEEIAVGNVTSQREGRTREGMRRSRSNSLSMCWSAWRRVIALRKEVICSTGPCVCPRLACRRPGRNGRGSCVRSARSRPSRRPAPKACGLCSPSDHIGTAGECFRRSSARRCRAPVRVGRRSDRIPGSSDSSRVFGAGIRLGCSRRSLWRCRSSTSGCSR